MRRFALLVLLAVASGQGEVLADGKYYGPPAVNLSMPFQRALIGFNGRQQALVLQSSVEGAGAEKMGWVVPVPSDPHVGTYDAQQLAGAFRHLDRGSAPTTYNDAVILVGVLLALYVGLGLMRMKIVERLVVLAIVALLWTVALPTYQGDGVEARYVGRAGDFEVTVLRAKQAADLAAWLSEAGFRHGPADLPAIERYLREGWRFVVAKLAADAGSGPHERRVNRPLVLQFDTPTPVYPLRLTALAGGAVQVHLYVIAGHRMASDDRFRTAFAGPGLGDGILDRLLAATRFAGDAKPAAFPGGYVTRLDARLEPAQMAEDLRLRQAADDAPYRRTVVFGN